MNNQTTILELRKNSKNQTKQSVVAMEMSVQEPAISKLERKTIREASVDKLLRYVSAIGGTAELVVTLDNGEKIVVT